MNGYTPDHRRFDDIFGGASDPDAVDQPIAETSNRTAETEDGSVPPATEKQVEFFHTLKHKLFQNSGPALEPITAEVVYGFDEGIVLSDKAKMSKLIDIMARSFNWRDVVEKTINTPNAALLGTRVVKFYTALLEVSKRGADWDEPELVKEVKAELVRKFVARLDANERGE